MARLGRTLPVASTLTLSDGAVSPITFDSAGAGFAGGTGAANPSFPHIIAGNALLVYVEVDVYNSTPTVNVSCGGLSMTPIAYQVGPYYLFIANYYFWGYGFVFGLSNPPKGTQAISVSVSNCNINANNVYVGSVSYNNVGRFGIPVILQGQNTAGTISTSVSGGQLISQAWMGAALSDTAVTGYLTKTERFACSTLYIGDAVPPATFATTSSGSLGYCSIAVPLIQTPYLKEPSQVPMTIPMSRGRLF